MTDRKPYAQVKVLDCDFETAVARIRELAPAHQLGIVYEVNVQQTIRNKLGADFRPYLILGLCNPAIARAAIEQDEDFGALLPCAVAVQAVNEGQTRVSFYDLPAVIDALSLPGFDQWNAQVREKLAALIAAL